MNDSTDKQAAVMLARLAAASGITDAVLCPGSRNAPVNVAVAGTLRTRTAVDERAGAFMALGMSLASGRPVLFVCTSGSALLDAAPAVAEAFYRRLPLIIVSADRPAEWIDQDDSQTIRQPGALAAVTRMTVDLPVETPGNLPLINRLINQALNAATDAPVHINIRLDAPLGHPAVASLCAVRRVPLLRPAVTPGALAADPVTGQLIRDLARSASGTLIYIGGLNAAFTDIPALELALSSLAGAGMLIVAEFQSGLRGSFITPAGEWSPSAPPRTLISFGGAPVIDRCKSFLRLNSPARHVRLAADDRGVLVDTYLCLTETVAVDPLPFLQALASAAAPAPCRAIPEVTAAPSSPEAALVGAAVTAAAGMDIHLSNGMVIRHAQRFRVPEGARVFCNRGVSGIDGSTSTAVGSAAVSGRPTLLITGDMSFIYDLGALSLPGISSSLRVMVIDNGGGDIFRHVSSTCGRSCREQLFCRPGGRWPGVREVASAWGFSYAEGADPGSVTRWMTGRTYNPSLLRVITCGHPVT